MSTPRKLSVKKPVKLTFSGGFLGSGKTTALAALAKRLIQREIREKCGLLLSPALAIEGVVVAQGKVYKPERIADLLKG